MGAPKLCLQICDAPANFDCTELPAVLSGIAEFVTRRFESAGRAFFTEYEGTDSTSESDDETDVAEKSGDVGSSGTSSPHQKKSHHHKSATAKRRKAQLSAIAAGGASLSLNKLKELTDPDHEANEGIVFRSLFEILQVSPSASADEIRKAYRKLALIHHPDKFKTPEEGDAAAEAELKLKQREFLKLQEAYEVLTDEGTRRQYESALPFDDDIPSLSELGLTKDVDPEKEIDVNDGAAKQFYEVLHETFTLNSKWSINRPVPDIGDGSYTEAQVQRFYDFWFSFESWRDFSKDHEYDMADAECREERRYMERQNAKASSKATQAEHQRILKLVELAHDNDPRLRKIQQKQERERKAKKEAIKKEREAERQKEMAKKEAARKEEEDAQNAVKAEREARQQRLSQTRHELRLRRRRIRCLVATFTERGEISAYRLSEMLQDSTGKTLVLAEIEEATRACKEAEESIIELLRSKENGGWVAPIETALTAAIEQPAAKKNSTDIEDYEIASELLCFTVDKELLKEVTELVKQFMDKYFATEEAKEAERQRIAAELEAERKNSKGKTKGGGAEDWTPEELSLLAKALQKYPGGTARRWELVANLVETKNADEVVGKAKEMARGTSLRALGPQLSQDAYNLYQRTQKGLHAVIDSAPEERDLGAVPQQLNPAPAVPAVPQVKSTIWTEDEQAALEKALQTHPSSMGSKERWLAIAKDVPGKSAKECLARFKEIREKILAQKGK
eukprot:GHVN01058073.1.p1 GENE.GHVN01058073.1~~GHVN01058073.1.p1  ORF type:complete len:738 (+),score=132.51 GHVN01058073.1:4155-6368(+)